MTTIEELKERIEAIRASGYKPKTTWAMSRDVGEIRILEEWLADKQSMEKEIDLHNDLSNQIEAELAGYKEAANGLRLELDKERTRHLLLKSLITDPDALEKARADERARIREMIKLAWHNEKVRYEEARGRILLAPWADALLNGINSFKEELLVALDAHSPPSTGRDGSMSPKVRIGRRATDVAGAEPSYKPETLGDISSSEHEGSCPRDSHATAPKLGTGRTSPFPDSDAHRPQPPESGISTGLNRNQHADTHAQPKQENDA